MNKRAFLTAAIVVACLWLNFSASMAQLPKETEEQKTARMKWWTDDRFGMFIHFGLYAQAARHEWVKKNERITNADYL